MQEFGLSEEPVSACSGVAEAAGGLQGRADVLCALPRYRSDLSPQ